MRLVLLLLMVAGVAGMHTIGHPTDSGHAVNSHGAAQTMAMAPAEPTSGPAMFLKADKPDPRMVMHPLNVCVAVLVGGILLLLAALLIRRQTRTEPCSVTSTRIRAGRGPPRSVLLGLTLADLSVQRT